MKTYMDMENFFIDCYRFRTPDGKLEDGCAHYERTQQMEFKLSKWQLFDLPISIHASAVLDPDVDFYEAFFDALKRHDLVYHWLISHAGDNVLYRKGELSYYDILAKAENKEKEKVKKRR